MDRFRQEEDYLLLGEIGRGGMGVVHEAVQGSLGRRVAVKRLPSYGTPGEPRIRRFLLEAEVIAHLEHPGIVPVHGMGRDAEGRPFYAMRFVRGETLRSAIDRFHQSPAAREETAAHSRLLRDLLRRFFDACNAVAFAHSKGVIHRDLKPENILLGPFGETLVVDWGLAKAIHRPGSDTAPADEVFRPFSALAETLPGEMMGTPRYMSPEQATGPSDTVGPASDVYSLGATLFTLLTGQPPHSGSDLDRIVAQVTAGRITRPRAVHPGVPPALEAVCLRAMALRPEDRYPSAQALAEEIERWLADEPVLARPDPVLIRIGRWGRRHGVLVAAAASLLTTATIALSLGVVLIGRAQSQTQGQRDEAHRQRIRAEASFRQAREAVDRYFTRVSEDTLLNEPGLQSLRKRLLEDALTYYQSFANREGKDAGLREDLAASRFRIGQITREIGRLPDARASYEAARALYANLSAEHPDRIRYRLELARCCDRLGRIDIDLGDLPSAESWIDQAHHLVEDLAARQPADAEFRHERARILTNRAALQQLSSRPEAALATYDQALGQLDRLVTDHAESPLYRRDLAATHQKRGILLRDLERYDRSRTDLERAVRLFEELAENYPDVPEYRFRLSFSQSQRATTLRRLGALDDALARFREARALMEPLVQANPSVHAYREELAGVLNNLGNLLRAMGHRDEAIGVHREAVVLREAIYAENPEKIPERKALAASYNAIAILQAESGRHAESLETFTTAQKIYRDVLAANPEDRDARDNLAPFVSNAGRVLAELGRTDEALSCLREAIALRATVLGSQPHADHSRRQQVLNWITLAEVLGPVHRPAEIVAAARAIRALGRGRADELLEAARLLSRSLPETPPEQRTAVASEALATLREAIAAGWSDPAWAGRNPDLDPLRGSAEFRGLMDQLRDRTFPADPFAH